MLPRVTAARNQFVALVGYAGAGKDVLANHLIAAGYVRHNYGDLIKAFYDPFTRGEETLHELTLRLLEFADEGVSLPDIREFIQTIAGPYMLAGHHFSAFTEDRNEKPHLRRILERGGELVYGYVQERYNVRLEELLLAGERVVNTRLCAISEAQASREYGHTVYLIERSNWAPATEWDAQVVERLEDGGFIHHTIYNDAASGEEWERLSLEYVQHNILGAARPEQVAA